MRSSRRPPRDAQAGSFEKSGPYAKTGGQFRERTVILFCLALLALNPPLLSIFSKPVLVFGFPLLYLYLFSVWGCIIVLIAFNARARSRESDEPGDPAGPGQPGRWAGTSRRDGA